MPKDIIITTIIINIIIIIIKALTATQGLEAKAEEHQAGIAAEGTDSPILWDTARGYCCPIPAQVESLLPQLDAPGLEALSCPSGHERGPCCDPSPPKALPHGKGSEQEGSRCASLPSSPDPTRIWARGRQREQAGRAPWHPLGSSQAAPAHGPFSFHGISSGALRMPEGMSSRTLAPILGKLRL